MNKAMVLVGIILLGVIALMIINVVQANLSGSELDYYLLRETTHSAMLDSVDEEFYAQYGVARIDKEMFVESFLRRFADSVDASRDYQIRIYNMNESPPKVSIRIDSATNAAFKDTDIEITTTVDAILESINKTDVVATNKIENGVLGQAKPARTK